MSSEKKELFRIAQVAKACSLSRSTILRMEESGLLTPAYIDPASGRRYYDNHNVSHIMVIENLKYMGLGKEEILEYFKSGGKTESTLAPLEQKLSMLQRSVEEMRIRSGHWDNLSADIIDLPECVCCVSTQKGLTVSQKYDAMYGFYHECVDKGYALGREPLFAVSERTDYLEGTLTTEPFTFHVCIPVVPEKAPAEAVVFPACRALSVLYLGSYKDVDTAWLALGREARERNLKPAGYPRVLGIVAPYTGREIDPELYCSRLVLPITEQD